MAIAATDATIQDERTETSSEPPGRTTIASRAKPTRTIEATGIELGGFVAFAPMRQDCEGEAGQRQSVR